MIIVINSLFLHMQANVNTCFGSTVNNPSGHRKRSEATLVYGAVVTEVPIDQSVS
jgi:hypothetical protein